MNDILGRNDIVEQWAELDALRKATGGLPPALVAKAMAHTAVWADRYDWTPNEREALRATTFEVPE